MKTLKIVLSLTIAFTAIVGDFIVFRSKWAHSGVFRAFADSTVHASIGFLSAILFFSHEINYSNIACFYNVLFCTFVSSFIDVDHVFVARSLYWKDLTTLKQRGIFHCTTFWLLITTILFTYCYINKKNNIYVLTWMLVTAYTSHHVRDANRRGLWIYPFGHTQPFSDFFYTILVALLPNLWSLLYIYTKPEVYKHTVINYNMLV